MARGGCEVVMVGCHLCLLRVYSALQCNGNSSAVKQAREGELLSESYFSELQGAEGQSLA